MPPESSNYNTIKFFGCSWWGVSKASIRTSHPSFVYLLISSTLVFSFTCTVAFNDRSTALSTLNTLLKHTNIHPTMLNQGGIDLLFESFFRQLLLNSYHKQVQLLRTKSRIEVPNGRVLMGIVDEFGVLDYGEIYACCSCEKYAKCIKTIIVTFNYYL